MNLVSYDDLNSDKKEVARKTTIDHEINGLKKAIIKTKNIPLHTKINNPFYIKELFRRKQLISSCENIDRLERLIKANLLLFNEDTGEYTSFFD